MDEEIITLENTATIEEESGAGLQSLGWIIVIIAILVIAGLSKPSPQLAQPAQQSTDTSVVGTPTISAQFIDEILCKYGSPACGTGQSMYDLGVQSNIDPAFALAVFFNESSFGTQGMASETHSLGNLRPVQSEDFEDNGYAGFSSWQDGYRAFYALIAGSLYVGDGLTTPEQIMTRYAPVGDNNDPNHYASVVESCIAMWKSGEVSVP